MLESLIAVLIIFSTVTAIFGGQIAETASAFLEGPEKAVTLVISIVGTLVLWSGLLKVLEKCGFTEKISKLLSPVIKLFFKGASKKTKEKISENVSANILGLGNAATPSGIAATEKLIKEKKYKTLGYFLLFNTASLQIFPTTVAAIRASNGAKDPFSIIIPVWIVSFISLAVGLLAYFILNIITEKKRKC